MSLSPQTIGQLKAALREDIGAGDITSELLVPVSAKGEAVILAKQDGVFSGAAAARKLMALADSKLKVKIKIRDGQSFGRGQKLIFLKGRVRSILKIERTLLNLLQHLCGVATQTRFYAGRVKGCKVKILDTRKTTPLWRELEKAAVRAGGGFNHRMGLYDQVFVKENHRRFGDLKRLLRPVCKGRVEVEVRNVRELMEALMLGAETILFDNFSVENLKQAVKLAREADSKVTLEASGGITLENIRSYAQTGVDQISVGALTHSVKAVDLSLLII